VRKRWRSAGRVYNYVIRIKENSRSTALRLYKKLYGFVTFSVLSKIKLWPVSSNNNKYGCCVPVCVCVVFHFRDCIITYTRSPADVVVSV